MNHNYVCIRQQGDLLVKISALSIFVGRKEARFSKQDGKIRRPNIYIFVNRGSDSALIYVLRALCPVCLYICNF